MAAYLPSAKAALTGVIIWLITGNIASPDNPCRNVATQAQSQQNTLAIQEQAQRIEEYRKFTASLSQQQGSWLQAITHVMQCYGQMFIGLLVLFLVTMGVLFYVWRIDRKVKKLIPGDANVLAMEAKVAVLFDHHTSIEARLLQFAHETQVNKITYEAVKELRRIGAPIPALNKGFKLALEQRVDALKASTLRDSEKRAEATRREIALMRLSVDATRGTIERLRKQIFEGH